jgi:hypothetical protein
MAGPGRTALPINADQEQQLLLRAYDLPPLPPLVGPASIYPVAAHARFTRWCSTAFETYLTASEHVSNPPVALQLMGRAIQDRFPAKGDRFAADIRTMSLYVREPGGRAWDATGGRVTPQVMLATWLLVRFRAEQDHALYQVVDAHRWASTALRPRHPGAAGGVGLDAVMAAYLVVSEVGWPDRFHAESAFRFLAASGAQSAALLDGAAGQSLAEAVSAAQVMQALGGK